MSFFDKLLKSFSPPEAQINEDGFYAIGKHKISGKKVREWSDMLRKRECPNEFTVWAFYEWRDEPYAEKGIPRDPNDAHYIEYKNIPFIRFIDDAWQLNIPSMIDGIPPVTAKEIPAIGGKKTITDPEAMAEMVSEMHLYDLDLGE
ncbi:MAG: hypothetical protein IIW63_01110 [Clostridia bacterium]|nr:hypothetical protein [Clostridia bacterium]